MFLHKAVDLTDREAASFAVFQSHGNQTAEKKITRLKSIFYSNSVNIQQRWWIILFK